MNRYIIPILLVIIASGLYIQYIDPTYTTILAVQSKLDDIEKYKIDAANAQEKIDTLERTTKTFPAGYEDRLRMMIPTTVDPTRLIIDVNEMAETQGLQLKSPQVSSGTNAKKTSAFVKHTITFSVTAPYDTFRKFISTLEYTLALRDTASVSFTSSSESDNAFLRAHPENVAYDYSFTITTYSLE